MPIVCGGFKQQDWQIQLAGQSAHQQFDVIIIHQALHELRHKMHAPDFHRAVKTLMHKNSIYIVCDHICAPHAMQNDQLYMNIAEHIESLREAVLSNIEWQRELNGLAIFRAGNIES